MNLNQADTATVLNDELDLEYDEDFASLVVDQNNIGKWFLNGQFY